MIFLCNFAAMLARYVDCIFHRDCAAKGEYLREPVIHTELEQTASLAGNRSNSKSNAGGITMKKELMIEGMMCQNCVKHPTTYRN